ncbi:class I SAM-dependent methyltransferase [uncultured Tateyamaria sp.]|uniref:class I SAM-dependent methyltransferase n=1 Tax=uncultured Tateyamaria sp. TaxID=455651 RepID=UPI002613BD28|nr:class I SAM-dependent methyltransferase [uncultured Tateyamaria sp.]
MARRYDAASRKWHHITRRYGLAAAYRKSLIASGVAAALEEVGPQSEVLDCGIGSGALSIALNSIIADTPNIHGIDLSSKMLARAASEMQLTGLMPDLRQADILSMPFADASFDVVMAAHVIEHLPDPQLALKEMVRVLKPGGMLLLCTVRRSAFGVLIQMRWQTWAISESQGIAWLRECHLDDIGFQPVNLGAFAGQASTAFWARRPGESTHIPEIDAATKTRGIDP